jgi:hypothetical protein
MKTNGITKVYASDNVHVFRLTETEFSSKKYGACEICKQHASEVFIQAHYIQNPKGGWRMADDSSIFGHKDCLTGTRPKPNKEVELESLTIGHDTWTVGK